MVSLDSHQISRVRWYSGTHPESRSPFVYRVVTFYDWLFQAIQLGERFLTFRSCDLMSPTTRIQLAPDAFRLFPVRSPLLRESRLISFPPGTEMFHFPGLSSHALFIHARIHHLSKVRVSPFGNPRIKDSMHLPVAYRSLARPSSTMSAKASTICTL